MQPITINTNIQQQQAAEGIFGSENLSSAFLEPVTSEEDIDYSKVYALFTFVASMEGQISVLKGEPLDLLDDSNSYWWAVKCISTDEIGYIPAENVETPFEKLARFNRTRNVDLAEVKNMDLENAPRKKKRMGKLQFAHIVTEIFEDGVAESELPPSIPEKDSMAPLLSLDFDTTYSTVSSAGPGFKKASFMDKLFGRKGVSPNSSSSTPLIKANPLPPPRESIREDESGVDRDQAPINVLRVFASPSVKFKASFKSVSFDKNTLISDFIVSTIRKFRARDVNPTDFYLTVTPIEIKSIGERVLLPNENINNVLDTYGVLSYLDSRYSDGKAKQADRTIKFTIFKNEDDLFIHISICRDDVPNSWEKLEVAAESNAGTVIALGAQRYQIPALGLSIMEFSKNMLLDPETSIKSLAQEAAANDQLLTLKLITRNQSLQPSSNILSRPRKVSLLDPGRPPSVSLLQPVSTPQVLVTRSDLPKASSIPASETVTKASISLKHSPKQGKPKSPVLSKSINFDELLTSLDDGIKKQSSRRGSVAEYLQGIESEIESLILSMALKASENRRKSRLSALYNSSFNQVVAEDVDTGDIFMEFNTTTSDLMKLESKLNGMLSHILLKNRILVGQT